MKRFAVAACAAIAFVLTSADARAQAPIEDPEPQQPATASQPDSQAGNNQAPEHGSTGWAALVRDTAHDFARFPRRRSTWVILGAGAAAALASHPVDRYVEQHVVANTTADRVFSVGKWAGSDYAMVASSVGLWAVGRYVIGPTTDSSKTNKYSEMGFDLMRAQILSQAIVQGMKYSVRRDRPTGECCSFPSGHAAAAFAAASVLERHFGYRGSWPFIAGAFYVGASRLVDNRHFLSDVMFGAAIGTASGWTVVGRHGHDAYALQPVPTHGGMMLAIVRQPRHADSPGGSHE